MLSLLTTERQSADTAIMRPCAALVPGVRWSWPGVAGNRGSPAIAVGNAVGSSALTMEQLNMSDSGRLFASAIQRIEARDLDLLGLITTADALTRDGQPENAIVLYKSWLLANAEHPLRYAAAFNCGSQLVTRGDAAGGREFLLLAIASNPDFYPARLNLANLQERMGDVEGALATFNELTAPSTGILTT